MPGPSADPWDINLLCPSLPSILPGDCKVNSDTVQVFHKLLVSSSKGVEAKVMITDGPSEQMLPRLHSRSLPRALATPGDTCP